MQVTTNKYFGSELATKFIDVVEEIIESINEDSPILFYPSTLKFAIWPKGYNSFTGCAEWDELPIKLTFGIENDLDHILDQLVEKEMVVEAVDCVSKPSEVLVFDMFIRYNKEQDNFEWCFGGEF